MGIKAGKWQEHLKAAEASGMTLAAFARVKVVAQIAPNPTGAKLAMQARLGNGVVLSWSHDGDSTQALGTVLHSLAALPCFI